MQYIDTLLYPRYLIPIEPEGVCLENHAIAINQGKILGIHPVQDITQLYQAKETVNLEDHILMPGLINTHAHSPMVLLRGIADDLALMDWLQNHIWPAESKWVGEEFVYDGTQLAILEMLRSGTTCFNEHYFYNDSIGKAAAEAGMRAVLGSCLFDIPTNHAANIDETVTKAEALYHNWKDHPLIRVSAAPHAPYTLSDESFKKVKHFADKYNLRIHLHLQETAQEVQESIEKYGTTPIARLAGLELLSENLQCVHMVSVSDDDIAILKQHQVKHIIHCPKSNLKLASGFSPIQKFIDKGFNMALGTDGACSNNALDLFSEMHTAALLGKAVAQDPTAITAIQALNMATINGARALGWDQEIGSLLPGKSADMIAVQMCYINTTPMYNPFSHLVYCTNSRQVSDVWVAGKRLLQEGEFTTVNKSAVLAKARQWREKIIAD